MSGRRRAPRPATTAGCPCGLPAPYAACCGRFCSGAAAPTAELLMRSRYSAHVRGDVAHLLASWHPSTRPAVVELDPAVRWTALEVLRAEGGLLDAVGSVHFRAAFVRSSVPGVLEERSRFGRDHGRWAYLAPLS